jgi:hypothetical protein
LATFLVPPLFKDETLVRSTSFQDLSMGIENRGVGCWHPSSSLKNHRCRGLVEHGCCSGFWRVPGSCLLHFFVLLWEHNEKRNLEFRSNKSHFMKVLFRWPETQGTRRIFWLPTPGARPHNLCWSYVVPVYYILGSHS